jgi:hypothetical protein
MLSSRHRNDVSRATKGIRNVTVVSEPIMVSKVTVESVIWGHCCKNMIQQWPQFTSLQNRRQQWRRFTLLLKNATNKHGWAHKVFLSQARTWRICLPNSRNTALVLTSESGVSLATFRVMFLNCFCERFFDWLVTFIKVEVAYVQKLSDWRLIKYYMPFEICSSCGVSSPV